MISKQPTLFLYIAVNVYMVRLEGYDPSTLTLKEWCSPTELQAQKEVMVLQLVTIKPRKLLVLLVGNAPTSHTYKVCALTFELKEYLIINIKSLNLYSILIIPLVLTYLIFYK